MDVTRKFLDVETKANEDGSMWFTASAENRDRQGDIVVADDWQIDNYMKNPVFLWAHDYSRPPIGKALDVQKGNGRLRMKISFVPASIDPFADQVRKLYEGGYLSAVSVGFMTTKRAPLTQDDLKQSPERQGGQRLSGELLELSGVPVPANPLALQNGFLEAVSKGMTRDVIPPETRMALADVLLSYAKNLDAVKAVLKSKGD